MRRFLWVSLAALIVVTVVVLGRRTVAWLRTAPPVTAGVTPTALGAPTPTITQPTGDRRVAVAAPVTPTVELSLQSPLSTPRASQPITATMAATAATPPIPAAQGAPTPVRFVQAVVVDADTLNPVLTTNGTSRAVAQLILPTLIGQDPASGLLTPTALAAAWAQSPDGRVYTFTLRSGVTWSDGAAVTARDVAFTYGAMAAASVQSPLRAGLEPIAAIQAVDERTLTVTLDRPDCAALLVLRTPILPSHLFAADYSDLRTNDFNVAPTVGAGPFLFRQHTSGAQITLTANPDHWQGAPTIDEYVLQVVPDSDQRLRQLAVGEVDLVELASEQIEAASRLADTTVYTFVQDSFTFVALNLADPASPQPGRDEGGSPIPPTPHRLLGDLRARRALALGVDYGRIVDEVYADTSVRVSSYVLPAVTWAHADDIVAPAYDPEQAAALLTAAGWHDTDRDGVRDRDGAPLRLTLLTNDDSPARIRIAQRMQEQLRPLGIDVQVSALAFETLADAVLGQRFDLAILGWDNLGADPGNNPLWHSRDDTPGTGFNFVSYQNAAVDGWLDAAASLPGCGAAPRGELYRQVQRQVAEDQPYIFLSAQLGGWAYGNRWQEITPGPWSIDSNIRAWERRR